MPADERDHAPPTIALAQIFLRQGDVWQAEKIYNAILAREPGNIQARAGLKECCELKSAGVKNMRDKKLAVLRLLLARLTGQPAPTSTKAVVSAHPRTRRLRVLQSLLEKVRAWRAQTTDIR